MKSICIILFSMLCCTTISAQNDAVNSVQTNRDVPSGNNASAPFNVETMLTDSIKPQLHVPTLTELGTMPSLGYCPYMWSGFHAWDVHEGLNASLGASVFSTFGSGHTWSGAGFAQNIALLYAKPLTNKLSFAIGGYFCNATWAHSTYRDAGLTAVLGYQFDQHWSGYLYAQKSLMFDKRIPYPIMDMNELGDRIGAAVRYTFNPNFSVQVSFEQGRR